MIPNPLKDWYADKEKQQKLATLLSDPIMKEAMSLLQTVAMPRADYVERSSADAITHAAMEHRRNTGFFSYPDHLWELTELPASPPKKPEGYSDSYVREYAAKHGLMEDLPETIATT